MSQPFEIDTTALGRAEGPFQALSTSLSNLADQIQNDLRALGSVWGDDKSGHGFLEKYGDARDQLIHSMVSTSEVVKSTADGVSTMSKGFGRTEESNTDAVQGLVGRTQGYDEGQGDDQSLFYTEQAPLATAEATHGMVQLRHAPMGRLRRGRTVTENAENAEPGDQVMVGTVRHATAEPMQLARIAERQADPNATTAEATTGTVRASAVRIEANGVPPGAGDGVPPVGSEPGHTGHRVLLRHAAHHAPHAPEAAQPPLARAHHGAGHLVATSEAQPLHAVALHRRAAHVVEAPPAPLSPPDTDWDEAALNPFSAATPAATVETSQPALGTEAAPLHLRSSRADEG